MRSAMIDGSCEPRRQPSEPPSMLVLLSEYATASCAKSSPPFALS
jgi:hypothetical protein